MEYLNFSLRPPSPAAYAAQEQAHNNQHHASDGACDRKDGEGRIPRRASNRSGRPRPRRRSPQGFKVLPGQVALRLFCPQSMIGGVIGNSGAIVSQLRRETDTKIHCENPAPRSDQGIVLVIGSRLPDKRIVLSTNTGVEASVREECDVSSAQDAMLRVLERIWTLEAENQGVTAAAAASMRVVSCRLLAEKSQIGAVMGKGGANIIRMRKESSANIRIVSVRQEAAGFEEAIQITGTILAAKKAFIAVSSCIQDQSILESEPTFFNRSTECSSSGTFHNSETNAEFFPNLSSLLPQTSFNIKNASFDSSTADANGVHKDGAKGTQQEVLFRLICSNDTAGSVIGKKGSIVRALENETGADIKFATPKNSSGERVVTISAFENIESDYSPAQNAVILVFARIVEGDIEKGFLLGFSNGTTVTAKLLVSTHLVSCLSENESKVIEEIKEVSGADIRIQGGTLQNQVVKITGEYRTVQTALFQVTSTLRNHLMHREVLNDVRARSFYARVIEPASSRPQQSSSWSLNATDEALLTSLRNRVVLSPLPGAFEPKSQLPQNMKTEYANSNTDAGDAFTRFGMNLEVGRFQEPKWKCMILVPGKVKGRLLYPGHLIKP
ncbi:KH domain-containing protein HEN4 isoform X2 [Humulus lupulus]|uniref:KH domain-containing protein HEN4 isoform X2 n=1 Tax=Humulus lupulus TaxID=3486 RepID=UPI002B405C6C|nr:KH domain-containing protein HEN4 isoform X2 [Humulus lupulus]